MTSSTRDDELAVLDRLVDHREPHLIGVRHHSPALAAAMPALLAAAEPEVLLVELPEDLGDWLPYLADPQLLAPVALSAASGEGGSLAFFPFADFSPELAAVRWAHAHGVEVRACDLPLAARETGRLPHHGSAASPLTDALRRTVTGRDGDDLWDRLVEAAAPGQTAEAVRRAALLVGWALRRDAAGGVPAGIDDVGEDPKSADLGSAAGAGVDPFDLQREAWMRRAIAQTSGRRCTAVIGSFHAAALLADSAEDSIEPVAASSEIVTALVPYGFALLDERSGYPAGIRDPEWQQAIWAVGCDPVEMDSVAASVIVRICAAIRELGHPAGPGEAREALRLAGDLARLRGLPAPGRSEVVEAIQSVLTQADPLGRGRVVARAAGEVLVGKRNGMLAPGTPQSGLGPTVAALLTELRMPGPHAPAPATLRLDPLRSALDARREITLRRLAALGIGYAQESAVATVGEGGALTTRWEASWTPTTAATLPVAGRWGITLPLAVAGRLRARRAEREQHTGHTPQEVLADLESAAQCALPGLLGDLLADAASVLPAAATLPELLTALDLLDRVRGGHLPDISGEVLATQPRLADELEDAAVAQISGLAGSEEPADARNLVELGQRHDARGTGLRLAATLRELADEAGPLIAGAAGATRVLLGLVPPAALGERIGSWIDGASTPERRGVLRRALTGVLAAAAPLVETPEALDPLLDRVESLPDRDFLDRLPALRGAFVSIGPAARTRILTVIEARIDDTIQDTRGPEPEALAIWLAAEQASAAVLRAYGLTEQDTGSVPGKQLPAGSSIPAVVADGSTSASRSAIGLSATVRWRLLLGVHGERPAGGVRYAAALDELYGRDRGEGADNNNLGADRSDPFPGVREWSEELQALFGDRVREEVLAEAAEGGRTEAALEIDPASARPSVELLRTMLSLAGGLSESSMAKLRPLVARIVRELTEQLAVRVRPALTGIQLPRPTRRPGGRLDLARTLRANLTTARRDEDGRVVVVPERPVFRTLGRRSIDWRLVLVVDVSGSMEASTVWSALTASVLAGVSTLSTHFLAFSTEIVDLTEKVDDPLSLLLEVRVGGGTHIAGALRHARTLVTVPERTMVVLVSDFEEGAPVAGLLTQVRELVSAGVTVLGCASLDDSGAARYSPSVARALVAAGMPVAALSPLELARWVGERVHG